LETVNIYPIAIPVVYLFNLKEWDLSVIPYRTKQCRTKKMEIFRRWKRFYPTKTSLFYWTKSDEIWWKFCPTCFVR